MNDSEYCETKFKTGKNVFTKNNTDCNGDQVIKNVRINKNLYVMPVVQFVIDSIAGEKKHKLEDIYNVFIDYSRESKEILVRYKMQVFNEKKSKLEVMIFEVSIDGSKLEEKENIIIDQVTFSQNFVDAFYINMQELLGEMISDYFSGRFDFIMDEKGVDKEKVEKEIEKWASMFAFTIDSFVMRALIEAARSFDNHAFDVLNSYFSRNEKDNKIH